MCVLDARVSVLSVLCYVTSYIKSRDTIITIGTLLPNITDRRLMTKLRISDLSLEIEKGRHKKPYKSPQDRLCPFCKTETQDEKHFLIKCNLYDNLRQKLTTDLKQRTNLDLDHLSEQNKFITLLNSHHRKFKTWWRNISKNVFS